MRANTAGSREDPGRQKNEMIELCLIAACCSSPINRSRWATGEFSITSSIYYTRSNGNFLLSPILRILPSRPVSQPPTASHFLSSVIFFSLQIGEILSNISQRFVYNFFEFLHSLNWSIGNISCRSENSGRWEWEREKKKEREMRLRDADLRDDEIATVRPIIHADTTFFIQTPQRPSSYLSHLKKSSYHFFGFDFFYFFILLENKLCN